MFYDATGTFAGSEIVIDLYGDISTDGTGESWEFLDGWAYRVSETNPNSVFTTSEWTFSGINQLEGGITNATTTSPFPIGTFIYTTCTAPSTQATFAAASAITDNGLTLNPTRGNGDGGIIILAKKGSAVDATPESGTVYTADAAFGSGDEIGTGNFVVFNGAASGASTAFTQAITNLQKGTEYHFAAFEYNTGECYLSPAATESATTTGDADPEIISAVTPATETSNDIIMTFSEDVTFTTSGGFAIEIGAALATINSQTQTASNEITLTLAETISKNSDDILISHNPFAPGASVEDLAGNPLQGLNYDVTNNTTLNVVANISEARALSSGNEVKITGEVVVSFQGSGGDKIYVQDATAGILIDDNATIATSYSSGDGIINLTGTLTSGNGVIELEPSSDPGAPNSTANVITPIVVTIADFNSNYTNYESRVLKFEEVTFDAAGSDFANGGANLTVSDGTNDLTWRDNDSDARFESGTTVPYSRLDIIAIGASFNTSPQVIPFSTTEAFEDNYAPLFSQAPAAGTPTVSAFDVSFRLDEPGTVYYIVNQSATAPDASTVLASSTSQAYADPAADGIISLTGLDDNIQYYVHMLATDDEGTPNEQTAVTSVNATTLEILFDATSDIGAADTPIGAATLSSIANSETDAIDVFNFKVTDDNATDTEPTTINTIVIENNNSATWSSIIEGASITDGTTASAATTITDTEITFDVSATPYVVTGSGELTFTLSVWLKTTQSDGLELQFTIPTDHSFEADAAGSVIQPTLGAALTSATHTIDVVATTFETTAPARVKPATDFSVGVIAQDANGNTDVATRSINLSVSTGTLGTLSSATGLASQAMVDGTFTYTDVQYSLVEDIVLAVTDGSISSTTSVIEVTETQVETFDNYPETGSSYVDGTFTGQDGSTWTYVQSRGDQTIDGATPMLGRGRTPDAEVTSGTISGGIETLTFDYSQAFSSNVDLDVYINEDSVTTVTSTSEQGVTLSSGPITIELEGDFTISFRNPRGGQVNIDNITWSPYVDPCVEPTTQATALNATVVDNNTIDLAWTVGNGDATIILAKQGVAVDAVPEILNAYAADGSFGLGTELGTGNFVVYNGDAATVQVTDLIQGTVYHFAAYAFNTTNNCYYLVDPALANATTSSSNDSDSDIAAADAPIAAASIPATANTAGDAVSVFSFKVSDLGTADGVATIIESVKIVPGENNSAAWSTVLAGATLADNTFTASNATITDESIIFDLSANAFTVNDGADSTLTLSVYLNTTQTDRELLSFAIPTAHEFVANGSGSLFADAVTGASSNDHTINVAASTFALTSATAVNTEAVFSIGVTAVDVNGNTDTAARTVTVSGGTGTLSGTTEISLTEGVGTFSGLSYDTEEAVTFTISDGTINATRAITFSTPSGNGTLFFSEYIEGSSNNKAIEIYNATGALADLSEYRIIRYNNGATDASDTLELENVAATLAAGELIVIANPGADQAILDVADLTDEITFYNGNDALMLYRGEELIDAFGLVGEDPTGGAWSVAGVDIATKEYTLVRKSSVTFGNATPLASFGTDAASSEWIVNPQNDFTNIGIFGALTEPTIIANSTGFNGDFGFVAFESSSAPSSYIVSAVNLTTDLLITAPAGFELSLTSDFATSSATLTLAQTDGEVAETTVYVRFTPTAADGASYSGDIAHTATDAATVNLAVSGTEGALALSTIAEVRANNTSGDLIKVTGIVIGGVNHSSASRAIYDGTAGITVRGFDFPTADLVVGDSIIIEGTLGEFAGLLQLEPTAAINVAAQGLALPEPQVKAITEIDESVESELVLVQNVRFVETGLFAGGGSDGNFRVANDAGDTIAFRLGSSEHPLVGTAIPSDYVNITAWVGQFNDDYQLSPETAEDIVIVPSEPILVVAGADNGLAFASIEAGTVSTAQSFTVAGTNLDADIVVTAPGGYEVSESENGTYSTSLTAFVDQAGEVVETTVFVRFSPAANVTGAINGDLTITSADLSESVSVTGTATEPVATANQKALTGITAYPNPTNHTLWVDFAENTQTFNYQVFSLNGVVLVKGKASRSVKVNMADLQTGIYMLEITQDDKVFRTRIAKN